MIVPGRFWRATRKADGPSAAVQTVILPRETGTKRGQTGG
jgi:hypothetical protein